MEFEGKNVLVAGASAGIGLSLVKALSAGGATVYAISRSASAEWDSNVKHLSLDITGDLSAVLEFLPDTLHGLVYSIGSINLKPFARLSTEDFLNDYTINVLGAARLIQQALKQ